MVAAADATKFVTETKNGKPGVKLESFRNANLSGKPESTQVVRHLNEPGTTWNDLVLDPESLVEFFSAIPKSCFEALDRVFRGIAGRRV